MSFNLDDYVEVNVRVEKFWADYPKGRIDTQIIKWEGGIVGFKASVFKDIKDEKPAATGHAYEKEGSTFVNKTSYLENCETSAVGRALALMGYEIKTSIASKEEVANARHQQAEADKVKTKKTAPKPKTWTVGNIEYTAKDVGELMLKHHKGDRKKATSDWNLFKDLDKEMQISTIEGLLEGEAT